MAVKKRRMGEAKERMDARRNGIKEEREMGEVVQI